MAVYGANEIRTFSLDLTKPSEVRKPGDRPNYCQNRADCVIMSSFVEVSRGLLLYFDKTQNVNVDVNSLISAPRLTRTAQND